MKKGTVKFFDEVRGFGFIKPDDSNQDVFVHKTGLIDSIQENDKVEFTIETGAKGPFASEVKRA